MATRSQEESNSNLYVKTASPGGRMAGFRDLVAPGQLARIVVAAFALGNARSVAAATPIEFVDCHCLVVGNYVLPIAPVAALPASGLTGVSPGGKYSVSAQPGSVQAAAITVRRLVDGAVLLNHEEAADWGFSPDDDRFVVAASSVGGAPARIALYDLTSVPAVKLHESNPSAAGSAVSFSPHGAWYVDVELEPTPSSVTMVVLDAQTGAQVHQDSFPFTAPTGLPEDELGAVALGFGPDTYDRTVTYAYLTTATSSQWTAVNLTTGAVVVDQQPGEAFTWGFSPCGDVIGIVDDNGRTSIKSAEVFATLAGGHLGVSVTFPATDDASLSLDVNNHLVTHNVTTEALAPNTAPNACPPPPTNAPPTAAFSAPVSNLSLRPVLFTDHSSDSDGRVVAWSWNFGDGQFSSLRNPTHVFLAGGPFDVKLTVTDDRGATGSVTHSVAVTTNQPPHAAFIFAPDPVAGHDVVTVTSQSTDPDDGIASLDWDIDGVAFSGPTAQARACPPTMNVTLTATDLGGQSDSVTQAIPVASGSSDIHVPAGGDLAAAFALTCRGDRLLLDAGHYRGGVTVPATISIKGAGMGATFIDGPAVWVLQIAGAARGLAAGLVSDLTISGGTGGILFMGDGDLSAVEITGNGAGGGVEISDRPFHINIAASSVHDNAGMALDMSCCAAVFVDHSVFAHNGGGVSIWEADALNFVSNDVHDNAASGMIVQVSAGPAGQARQILLSRVVSNGSGVHMDTGMLFAGNLVARNRAEGVTGGHPDQITVLDSTIADNSGAGLAATMSAWNTIVVGNGTDLAGALAAGDHNLIGGDAGFVGAGDYHLAPGSPAIDKGDNARVDSALTVDSDGDPRILNGGSGTATVDIGWDEALSGAQGGDGGIPDAGNLDGGQPDAGQSDAGQSDAGEPDAGQLDAGQADAGLADAGASGDGGGSGGGPASGCGCRTASPSGTLAWMGGIAWLFGRRRRRVRGARS